MRERLASGVRMYYNGHVSAVKFATTPETLEESKMKRTTLPPQISPK